MSLMHPELAEETALKGAVDDKANVHI